MFHRKKECVEERVCECVCVRTERRERERAEERERERERGSTLFKEPRCEEFHN